MSNNDGPGLVEYALILILIAIVVIGVVVLINGGVDTRCTEGYFWSTREYACIPGYRP